MTDTLNPAELRRRIRSGEHRGNTSGLCPGYVQANLMILPADWAMEFLQFCRLNPKPCPLVGMASEPGDFRIGSLGEDLDLRTDVPSYRVFENGEQVAAPSDISDYWRDDLVAFAIGCSFSFEEALLADGLEIRNISEACNVPMYRTNIACTPSGRLKGDVVVSMRPFAAQDAIRAIQISTRFPSVHGAPMHMGDPALIGIHDLQRPDFGDAVTINPVELPLFWGCGVTPQAVVEASRPPFCISHGPGDMLVTDVLNSKLAIL